MPPPSTPPDSAPTPYTLHPTPSPSPGRYAAIVLAAGESRRMGRPKMMLPYGDTTVVGAVVRALLASRTDSVTVVVGFHAELVRGALTGMPVSIVANPAPERGMLTSAQAGVRLLPEELDGFLFVLGDQPQLRAETVDALLQAAAASPAGFLVPSYQGKRGHPLLVKARYRDEILSLPESVGLNALLAAHPNDIEEVPTDTPSILRDIDTPEDYTLAVNERQ